MVNLFEQPPQMVWRSSITISAIPSLAFADTTRTPGQQSFPLTRTSILAQCLLQFSCRNAMYCSTAATDVIAGFEIDLYLTLISFSLSSVTTAQNLKLYRVVSESS